MSLDERHVIIRDNFQSLSNYIIKYDYYFSEIPFKIIETHVTKPDNFFNVKDFLLITEGTRLVVWNMKTNKNKEFTLPLHTFHMTNPILYGNNKLAFGLINKNKNGSIIGTYIGLIDGDIKYHKFDIPFNIFDLKILNDTTLLITSGNNSIRTLNVYTLEEDTIPIYPSFLVLPYKNNKIIITGTNLITLWDFNNQIIINTINIPIPSSTNIQFLTKKLFLVKNKTHIFICDVKEQSIVNTINISALELKDKFADKVTILKDKIILLSSKHIFVLDFGLHIRFKTPVTKIWHIDVLPNNQLLTFSGEKAIVWNTDNFKVEFAYQKRILTI